MKILHKFINLIDIVNDRVGNIGYLIPAMGLITTFEVVSRYFFNRPTIWVWDTNTEFLSAMALLAGGYTLFHGGHVRVDVFTSRFTPKMKEIVELFFFILLAIFCVPLIWKSIGIAWYSFTIRESLPGYWKPPVYPIKMLVPIAGLLLLLQGLSRFIRSLLFLIKGKQPK